MSIKTDDFYQAWRELERIKFVNNYSSEKTTITKELYRVLCRYKESLYIYNGEIENFIYNYNW